ncbi:MAG: RdgB/HAM1 family non-canonical purine NTP pyrophosphatase [Alcaligenaceae bacterium]|nr:RdgB/HAM1 family non-canonical purine NTP pyrophosphatase [Alcaligenaceae bacterium]
MENETNTSAQPVVLASNNAGKLREFSAILGRIGWSMIPQGELGVAEADEPHLTFVENALAKARHASRHTGKPALADDSGLCVHALKGAPGVFSARYAALAGLEKSDAANNAWLVKQLQGIADRRAAYVAVLVYVRSADDPIPVIAQGIWPGEIVDQPRGEHGFGYDPHFYIPELGLTVAELAPDRKNTLSHRARALQGLVSQLSHVS